MSFYRSSAGLLELSLAIAGPIAKEIDQEWETAHQTLRGCREAVGTLSWLENTRHHSAPNQNRSKPVIPAI
jgi:hypothetical protein